MLSLLSPALFTNHRGADTPRQPSTRIWSKVKGEAMSPDGTAHAKGVTTSFENAGAPDGVDDKLGDGCLSVGATQSLVGKGVAVTGAGAGVETGGGAGAIGTVGEGLIAYETNLEVAAGDILCGIGSPGALVAGVTGTTVAAGDFIGFVATGGNIKFVYQKSGYAQTAVSAVSVAQVGNTAWQKLGFLIDPARPAGEYLSIYVDTKQVASLTLADITAANWPAGAGFAGVSAADGGGHIDWLNVVLVA